ncbi:MAG: hypothetical protein LBP33_01200 [Candidatus Adiutrix sp.]|jgi:hypothetical protein|nr:hypothetical protein [Candidatus Adiutrix sp.]
MSKGKDGAMERLVEELGYQVPFKETTEIGDTVIMLRENDDERISMVYARVLGFDRDLSKRDEWWHVHFVFLEVPPLPRTIILQAQHFTGQEIFTMGGRKVFIKSVNFEAFSGEWLPGSELPKNPGLKKGPDPENESKKSSQSGKPTFTLIK